jgi:hypothetical protein
LTHIVPSSTSQTATFPLLPPAAAVIPSIVDPENWTTS